jgi:hypothetical protein
MTQSDFVVTPVMEGTKVWGRKDRHKHVQGVLTSLDCSWNSWGTPGLGTPFQMTPPCGLPALIGGTNRQICQRAQDSPDFVGHRALHLLQSLLQPL